MAGYGGQLTALNVNTPSESQLAGAQADQASTSARMARAAMPAELAIKEGQAEAIGLANQFNTLSLDQQRQIKAYKQHVIDQIGQKSDQSPLASYADQQQNSLFDPRIEQAMRTIDPDDPLASEKWDQEMTALAKDVPQAKQFIGQFSKGALDSWRGQAGAHSMSSPLAQASAPQMGSPLSQSPSPVKTDGLYGGVPDGFEKWAALDPEGANGYMKMHAMLDYQRTGDENYLLRGAPDVAQAVAQARQTMSGTQIQQTVFRNQVLGQRANAALMLADKVREAGGNPQTDPEVKAAFQAGVMDSVKDGLIAPDAAKKMLQGPINLAGLAATAATAQTINDAFTNSGKRAENEAKANAMYQPVHTAVVPGMLDDNGNPIYYNINGPPPVSGASGSAGINDFVGRVNHFEASGDPNARNPASSATGLGQFTKGTWLGLMQQHPDLTQGKSQAEILAMRSDPAIANQMIGDLARQNGSRLASANLPVTGATLGAAHSIGSGGAEKVLHSSPDTPMTQILSPDEAKTNPQWAKLTAGGFMQQMASQYGNSPIDVSGTSGGPRSGPLEGQAQAIARGDLPPLTGRAAVTGQGGAIMRRVYQIKPDYDAKLYAGESAAVKNFMGGKNADLVRSFGVGIDHLQTLNSAALALDNGNIPAFNNLANKFASATGEEAPTNFDATKAIVAAEVTKAIVGGQMTEGDRNHVMAGLSAASSPKQLAGYINQVVALMTGQLRGLKLQYEQTTGKDDFGRFLPDAASRLVARQHGGPRGAPAVGSVQQGFRFKGGNPADRNSWEAVQ